MEILIIVWIVLALVVGKISDEKGGSFGAGFGVSLLIGPLLALIIVLARSPMHDKIEQKAIASGVSKKCPYCAELIKNEAKVCRFCGREVNN